MLWRHLQPATFVLVTLAAACGGEDDKTTSVDAAPGSADAQVSGAADAGRLADAGSFGLSSTALQEGGVIPTVYTCQGDNISPPLVWGNAPEGTQAFALVFTDLSINFLHSAMWDIPMDRFELPEDVEQVFEPSDVPGAKQPNSYAGTRGYAGPCPGNTHTYEFRLHAVDAAVLSGIGQQSTRAQVVSAIEAASIASVSLSASFDPSNP